VLSIGLVYDLLGTLPRLPGDPHDADAEYEPEATVLALEAAIASLGHRPVRIGNAHALLAAAGKGELPLRLDAAMSIAEGYGSRNREGWAPVLLEMLGVPCIGSDAHTLSTCLDKLWAKEKVAVAGVACPAGCSVGSAEEARTLSLPGPFPLFVKPRWEGTAKGIDPRSRVASREELVTAVERIVAAYRQPALVEVFVEGPEYTVTIVGHDPPRALPVLQRALEVDTRIGLHALERHAAPGGSWRFALPGALAPALESELRGLALRTFHALECLDFARADFRLDAARRPLFLEINPLPTFAPDGSFGILAELEGRSHEALLADVIADALRRLGLST
jgi:D-alanine-D-alanine ligase